MSGATSYKLQEAITNASGYKVVETTAATATSFDHIVPLYARLNAKYVLQSCNAVGCSASAEVFTSTRVTDMFDSIGYFKASNPDRDDNFGSSVSVSGDGNTLAVGALYEDSNSQAVQTNGSAQNAGAVYVFTRNNTTAVWSQQAYLKPTIIDSPDEFGISVSLSADGNTLAVGAVGEASDGTGSGVNLPLYDSAGAAYVFTRSGRTWTQVKYLKASNAGRRDYFGQSVSLSANGKTLAVGAPTESGSAAYNGEGVDNNDTKSSGAVYVFAHTVEGTTIKWTQQKYLKASNAGSQDLFGWSVSLSADGLSLAVGAYGESSGSTMIDIGQSDSSIGSAGAVYVFAYSNAAWLEQAYLKASNTGIGDRFGWSVSLSTDGNTLAVGAPEEDSSTTGANDNTLQSDNDSESSGAVYVFIRDTIPATPVWSQQAYIKASNNSNAGTFDQFGWGVSISGDGNTLAVSAKNEGSNAVGIHNQDQTNSGAGGSGAVYTFTRPATTTTWSQQAYIKARNTGGGDSFGYRLALSADGDTLAVSANNEDGNAMGVNPDEGTGADASGAVYLY